MPVYLRNKRKSQGCFVPSLVEIGSVVLEKIFKFRKCIFPISLLSPLGKRQSPSVEQTWIPFTKRWFVPSLVEIGPKVLETEDEKVKSLRRRQRQWRTMDKFWSEKLTWALNLKKEKFTDKRTDKQTTDNSTWAFSSGELKIVLAKIRTSPYLLSLYIFDFLPHEPVICLWVNKELNSEWINYKSITR